MRSRVSQGAAVSTVKASLKSDFHRPLAELQYDLSHGWAAKAATVMEERKVWVPLCPGTSTPTPYP